MSVNNERHLPRHNLQSSKKRSFALLLLMRPSRALLEYAQQYKLFLEYLAILLLVACIELCRCCQQIQVSIIFSMFVLFSISLTHLLVLIIIVLLLLLCKQIRQKQIT